VVRSGLFSSNNTVASGFKLLFNIKDDFGNNIDTILKSRNNPDLGQI
jgi:hypothetical protein